MERLVRIKEIVGDKKADPPIKGILPISRATWLAGVRAGRFPAPVKLGPRITCWRSADVMALTEKIHGGKNDR